MKKLEGHSLAGAGEAPVQTSLRLKAIGRFLLALNIGCA